MDVAAAALAVKDHYFNPEALHEDLLEGQYPAVANTVRSVLEPGARVLDFGSGGCDIPALLSLLGYSVDAADDLRDEWHMKPGSREAICTFARRMGVRFHTLEDGRPWPWKRGQFDMVMLHHVLEHLHDSPKDLLNRLLELVRPEGYLFVTVPNAGNLRKRLAVLAGGTNLPRFDSFYWSDGPWRGHVREYVRPDLEAMAEFLGLDVREVSTFHSMTRVLPARVRPAWRAVTALHPAWRDTWLMLAQKKPGWRPRLSQVESIPFPAPARTEKARPAVRTAFERPATA